MVVKEDFRKAMGMFATGVTVVTVNTETGPHGMTVNSFASVSLEPPLLLFNADRSTDTHGFVSEAEHYAVNVLTQDQEWLSNRFAGKHKEMDDPFADVKYTERATGAPIIQDTLATFDCTLWEQYDGGDHTIYVGEVQDLSMSGQDMAPLTFYKGAYGTIS